ncbi:MAG: hypothetical protein ACO1TE_17580 [Prosthecobacter sp.]
MRRQVRASLCDALDIRDGFITHLLALKGQPTTRVPLCGTVSVDKVGWKLQGGFMHLADALAMSIVYIATRENVNDDEDHYDVTILESITAELHEASPSEIDALRESANRLATLETDIDRREQYQNLLSSLGIDSED